MAANGNVAAALQYAILQQQQQLLQQAAIMTRSQATVPMARQANIPCVGSTSTDAGNTKQQPTLEALLLLERLHRGEQFSAAAGLLNQQTNHVQYQPHVQYQQQQQQHGPYGHHAVAATHSALSAAQVQFWEQQQRAVLLALLRQQQQLNLQQLLSSYSCSQGAGSAEAGTSPAFWSSNATTASPQTVSTAAANLTQAVMSSNLASPPSATVSSFPLFGSLPSEAQKAGPPTIFVGEVPCAIACDAQLQQQQQQRQLRQSPKAVHEFGCWSDMSDSEAGSSVGGSSERGELDEVLSSCGSEAVDGLDEPAMTEGGLGLPSEEDFQLHLLGVLTSYL